jgi:hypothetical protein
MSNSYVIVNHDGSWYTGMYLDAPQLVGAHQYVNVYVDAIGKTVTAKRLGVEALSITDAAYSASNRRKPFNDAKAAMMLVVSNYDLVDVPPILQAQFKKQTVLYRFHEIAVNISESRLAKILKYKEDDQSVVIDTSSGAVDFELLSGRNLPYRISNVIGGNELSITVRSVPAGGMREFSARLPSTAAGTLRLNFHTTVDGIELTHWRFKLAKKLVLIAPSLTKLDWALPPGAAVEELELSAPKLASLAGMTRLSVSKLLLQHIPSTRFSLHGLPPGVNVLQLSQFVRTYDNAINWLPALLSPEPPKTIVNCNYTDILTDALNQIHKTPKSRRRPLVLRIMGELRADMPKGALSLGD